MFSSVWIQTTENCVFVHQVELNQKQKKKTAHKTNNEKEKKIYSLVLHLKAFTLFKVIIFVMHGKAFESGTSNDTI